jgi:hypothetical protein
MVPPTPAEISAVGTTKNASIHITSKDHRDMGRRLYLAVRRLCESILPFAAFAKECPVLSVQHCGRFIRLHRQRRRDDIGRDAADQRADVAGSVAELIHTFGDGTRASSKKFKRQFLPKSTGFGRFPAACENNCVQTVRF